MIKVILADDHELIREGIKKLLDENTGIKVIADTHDALLIQELVRKNKCDVLLLDISMPQKNGLEVLKDIKAVSPSTKILMLSMMPEDQFAKRALKAGASGYLKKDVSLEEMIAAIKKVAGGKKYISESLAEKLAGSLDEDENTNLHDQLSNRELQVFNLLAKGKTQSEIAEELFIGISSVNTYRSRILEKLNLQSTADIIHYSYRHKLLD
jgi:two-component system, NarL family, invasion response regulator UvrY